MAAQDALSMAMPYTAKDFREAHKLLREVERRVRHNGLIAHLNGPIQVTVTVHFRSTIHVTDLPDDE